MFENNRFGAVIIGLSLFLGLVGLGNLIGNAIITFKEYERTVTAKGLSEREVPADIVIWPIQFTEASNNLSELYNSIEKNTSKIRKFLVRNQVSPKAISYTTPAITDKSAQQYSNSSNAEFRYTALQTVTVYSRDVAKIRNLMSSLAELGREGIVFISSNYDMRPQYLFTGLNDIKPEMIEEATRKARDVALKFAVDSKSRLGKIKKASQGQFSIAPRDTNNPHIKKIRVVSTVSYYLSD